MKILFIIPGLSVGGQEKMGMILTTALSKYHEVITVCFEKEDPQQYNYTTPIIRILNGPNKGAAGKLLNIAKRVTALRRIKKSFKPDVSIAFGETAIVANAFTYTNEIKIASLRQSLKFITAGRVVYKKAYKLHDKLIPVSSGINKQLKEIYGINNSLFINNGYDLLSVRSMAKEELPVNLQAFFNQKVIAHLGRFALPKAHWHLVKIFILVKQQIPDAKLLLLGDYNNENEIFNYCIQYLTNHKMNIALLGVDNATDFSKADVLIAGHQKNPFKFLAKADLFAFPSIWEGFPGALIEAMACGLPVIAADCTTGPEEILQSDSKYGVLLPSFQPDFSAIQDETIALDEQWANEIKSLLSNQWLLADYKMKALQRSNDFTIQENCRQWLKVIEEKKS